MPVENFTANARSSEKDKFRYLRDEAWWYLRNQFHEQSICIPNDDLLKRQVSSLKYTIDGKQIVVESKSELKKRHGKSPDRADALMMAVWGTRGLVGIEMESFRVTDREQQTPQYRPTDRYGWGNQEYAPFQGHSAIGRWN